MFDFLIKWRINSAFKNNDRTRAFRNMDSMKNILILFTYEDWKEIHPIVQDLERKGKKITMWTLGPKKQDTSNIIFPENAKVIHPNELSFFQILSAFTLGDFRNLSYDTLIDMTTTKNSVLEYLLAQNTAEFCVGITESERKVYDFVIIKEEDKSLQETYDQIKFYLNNLR